MLVVFRGPQITRKLMLPGLQPVHTFSIIFVENMGNLM